MAEIRGRSVMWAAMLLAGVVGTAVGVPAAAADPLKFQLPAHVIIETKRIPDPGAPERCGGAAFAEFPHIRGAVGYAVTVDDLQFNYDGTRTGPPFPDDAIQIWKVAFTAPSGHHRFFLSAYNTPKGCAEAILGIEGRWEITGAKVSMSQRFTEQWKKPAKKCYYKTLVPIDEPVVIGKRGRAYAIEAHGNNVFVERADGTRYRLYNRTFEEGTVTIEVGKNTLVRVAGLGGSSPQGGILPDGSAAAIAPGTKVRITPGKPIEVLSRTPGMGLRDVPKPVRVKFLEHKVRTNSCILATRG